MDRFKRGFFSLFVICLLSWLSGCPAPSGPSCQDECSSENLQECDTAASLRVCQIGSEGCLVWKIIACPEGCAGEKCVVKPSCDTCKDGEARCDGAGVQICAKDTKGCLNFQAPQACQTGTSCQDGACKAGCSAETCTAGDKRCGQSGIQTCQMQGTCLQWSASEACPRGQICDKGACVRDPACDKCREGDTICAATGEEVKVCKRDDVGCLDFGPPTSCGVSQICQQGRCVTDPACNKCPDGKRECVGTKAYRACEKDPSGCLVFTAAQACKASEICDQGTCKPDTSCDTCKLGEKVCDGNGLKECVRDPSGCLAFGSVVPCASGTSCQQGACIAGCQDDKCQEGSLRCSPDSTGLQTCQKDGLCTTWSATDLCPSGQICQGSSCSHDPACDKCSVGQTRCAQDLVEQCGLDTRGCLVWQTPIACPFGQLCQGAACAHDPACDKCTQAATRCNPNGSGLQTCEKDPNACLQWSATQACKTGQICQTGACVHDPACDKCTEGVKRCNGDKLETCAKDANLCLTWGTAQACPAGQVCRGTGVCQTGCRDDACQEGAKRCFSTGVQTCQKNDICTTWITTQTCPAGQICQTGACVHDPACDKCTDKATRCDGSGVQTCGLDATACLVWGTTQACAQGESCNGGKCIGQPCQTNADCPLTSHCSQLVCKADLCPQGTTFCKTNAVYLCSADGSQETLQRDCAGQTCQAGRCICTQDSQCAAGESCRFGTCVDCRSGCGTLWISDTKIAEQTLATDLSIGAAVSAFGKIVVPVEHDRRGTYQGGVLIAVDPSTKALTTVASREALETYFGQTDYSAMRLTASPDGSTIFFWDERSKSVTKITAPDTFSPYLTNAHLKQVTGLSLLGYDNPIASVDANTLYLFDRSLYSLLYSTGLDKAKIITPKSALLSGTLDPYVRDIARMNDGSVLLFEHEGDRFLRVTSTGVVSTYMTQSSLLSGLGGTSVALYGSVVDPTGAIFSYSSHYNSETFVKISPTKLAGTFTTTNQLKTLLGDTFALQYSRGMALDSQGRVYAAIDSGLGGSDHLLRLSTTGTPEIFVSNVDLARHIQRGGIRAEALTEAEGKLLLWNYSSQSFLQIDAAQTVTDLVTVDQMKQLLPSGNYMSSTLYMALARDPSNGDIYLGPSHLYKRTKQGTLSLVKTQKALETALGETYPNIDALAIASGTVYAFSGSKSVLFSISPAGVVTKLADKAAFQAASISIIINGPKQMYFFNGALYFLYLNKIYEFTIATKVFKTIFSGAASGVNAELTALGMTASGDLIAFDKKQQLIRRITRTGTSTTEFATPNFQAASGGKPISIFLAAVSSTGEIFGHDSLSDDIFVWKK